MSLKTIIHERSSYLNVPLKSNSNNILKDRVNPFCFVLFFFPPITVSLDNLHNHQIDTGRRTGIRSKNPSVLSGLLPARTPRFTPLPARTPRFTRRFLAGRPARRVLIGRSARTDIASFPGKHRRGYF